MESRSFYNTILTEHNLHPLHKQVLKDANLALEGVNPSCGDDIWLKLKVENDKIVDGAFVGDGCAISQASADMMTDIESMLEQQKAAELIKYGLIIVSALPVLVIYPFLQKYFVKGVMIGSLKG